MKRTVTVIISLLLLVAVSACSISFNDSFGNASTKKTTSEKEQTINPPKTEKATIKTEQTTTPTKTEATTEKGIDFQEQTVVDNNECAIKITDVEMEETGECTVKIFLENKSADKTYSYSIEETCVNGIQISLYTVFNVVAGKKANSEFQIMDSTLNEMGITEFSDIELLFRVNDANDWFATSIVEVTTHIYPYGEDRAISFVREAESSDIVLFDNEIATVIVTGIETDHPWGCSLNVFIINKHDIKTTFAFDEVYVNGFMIDPYFIIAVGAGKCAFHKAYWSASSFQENGIENVEIIEFRLMAHDTATYGYRYIDETITITP